MDEPGVRAMLDKLAGEEPPSSGVSIEQARRQGRRRLRWRRASLAGAPVLAAAAVTIIVVTATAASGPASSVLPSGAGTASTAPPQSASPSPSSSVPAPPTAAPRRFNPAVPYVSWGWLPRGQSLVTGTADQAGSYLTAGPRSHVGRWSLATYAAGECRLTGSLLNCALSGSGMRENIRPGPLVSGRPAFWTAHDDDLVWQYARGGWAWLEPPPVRKAPDPSKAIRVAVRVAEGIRLGPSAGLSLAYAAQLTNLPGHWRLASTGFKPVSGRLLTGFSMIVRGHRQDAPQFNVTPAGKRSSCYFYPAGESVRKVINGYPVTINHIPPTRGGRPIQQICAADADGLFVFISEYDAHPLVGVASLFRDHLRLLGPDSANWAASPLG
jgi:hypothetical protein